ncbi:unnamed protein product, partial [Prorocentrum cordatum]
NVRSDPLLERPLGRSLRAAVGPGTYRPRPWHSVCGGSIGRVPGTAMFVVCCQDSHDREETAGDDSYAVLSITSECVRRGGARGSVGAPSPSAKQLRDAPRRHPASEEEAVEKARLQSLVDSFAKRAVRGCPCTYLDGMGRARIDALYRLDESLRRLTLLAKGDRSVIAECSIEDIQDIYLLEDDGEEPPEQAISKA